MRRVDEADASTSALLKLSAGHRTCPVIKRCVIERSVHFQSSWDEAEPHRERIRAERLLDEAELRPSRPVSPSDLVFPRKRQLRVALRGRLR